MSISALDILGEGGAVAKALAAYEVRPQQLEMAEAIAAALRDCRHLLVEAGTGVGKSFAYLVPAVLHVVREGGRVVVSTNTIALQEQLIHKDIPFLAGALPVTFKAVLVKGRSNYLGLRRLGRASQRQEQLFSDKSRAQLWAIEEWAYETRDGSLSDLPEQPDRDVWEMVRSDRSDCMGRRCPHYAKCFYQLARREAAEAQVLVVNHAMLFSDLAVRGAGASILPDYDYVVLDEAHTVEAVAAEHFGVSVTDAQVRFLLGQLYNERTGRGLLAHGAGRPAIAAARQAREVASQYFLSLQRLREDRPSWNGRLAEPPPVEERLSTTLAELHQSLAAVRNDFEDEQSRFEVALAHGAVPRPVSHRLATPPPGRGRMRVLPGSDRRAGPPAGGHARPPHRRGAFAPRDAVRSGAKRRADVGNAAYRR